MNSQSRKIILILTCIFFSGLASAATIRFDPATSSAMVGDSVDMAVLISDLGSGMAPSISTFDLDIGFDDSQLSFASATFGDPVLGDQLDIFGFGFNPTFSGVVGPGMANIFELSLDFASDLDLFQADSFTLATLTFDVIGAATGSLDIFVNALGDADGNPLLANTESAALITTNAAAVPAPAAIWLFLIGLSSLGIVTRKFRRY